MLLTISGRLQVIEILIIFIKRRITHILSQLFVITKNYLKYTILILTQYVLKAFCYLDDWHDQD